VIRPFVYSRRFTCITHNIKLNMQVHFDSFKTPCSVLIIGTRCTGKTTLANRIAEHLRRSGEVEIIDDAGFDVSTHVQRAKEHSVSMIVISQFDDGMNKIDFDYYIYASNTISQKTMEKCTAGKIIHGSNIKQIQNHDHFPFSIMIHTMDEKMASTASTSSSISSPSAL
jgi:hypothetical protein